MDLTFLLSAVIFTLLAIVVATSLLKGSPSSVDFARGYFGRTDGAKAGLDPSGAWPNGHVPGRDDMTGHWDEVSGSLHDHWEVVKSVQSEELQSHRDHAEHTSSQNTSDDSRCRRPSRSRSFDLDSPSAAPSSGAGRRSLIGLSEKALLKCAFSYPQTEGVSKSFDDMRYLPGQGRSNIETMMSKQELEEEQRVQREQLAAIFQLLKENKETFGEVSEGDLEDQFRLYSL